MDRALSAALAIIYPPICPVCQTPLEQSAEPPELCSRCAQPLQDSRPMCRRCARPLPTTLKPAPRACTACRNGRFAFERAIALGVYEDELRDVVLRIKKPSQEPLTIAIAKLLAERIRREDTLPDIDILAPVPVHWSRRLARGGSCPELLAETMSKTLGIRANSRLLGYRRRTRKQGTLLPSERRKNVHHAFRASTSYNIKGAHILLVDDVMTTGATASEIARELRKSDAGTITLAVVARGIGFDAQ